MPSTVVVNFMTVVHASSSGMLMCFPDVCKTPAPPAPPIPIPYPNIAQSSDTDQGTKKLKVDGNPAMTKASNFKMSSGDEAGSVGGVVSSKIKGKGYPQLFSMDVKFEGENVVRLTDIMCGNGASPGNTPPMPEIQPPNPVIPAPPSPETKQDPKKPKVDTLKLDPASACCGDEVKLEAGTTDFDDGTQLALRIVPHSDEKPASASRRKALGLPEGSIAGRIPVSSDLCPVISGNKGDKTWIVRRGAHQKVVKWKLEVVGVGAPKQSNELEIKTAEPATELVGPKQRSTPQYEKHMVGTTKTWVPSGKTYGWQMAYNIEIAEGILIVSRKLDFASKNGGAASDKNKRKWKKEIERIWDKKFKLHRTQCKRGDACACSSSHGCCQWQIRVVVEWAAGHGKKVDLHKGANSSQCPDCKGTGKQASGTNCGTCNGSGNAWGTPYWWYSHTWWEEAAGVPATVRAHEFGHLIGMYDEYLEGACDPARAFTDTDSIMGNGTTVYPRFYEEFQKWFDGKAKSVVGDTKLLRV